MEPDSKPQEISSIASNTPEQCQGDVDMLEHNRDKILLSEKVPCNSENVDNIIEGNSISDKKSLDHLKSKSENDRTVTPPVLENITEKTEKSPIKDDQENETDPSQPILSIDNSVLLSPPKSEPQGPVISPTDENTTASISPPSESQMSPLVSAEVIEHESNQLKDSKEKNISRPDDIETEISQDALKDLKFSTNSSSSISSPSPGKKEEKDIRKECRSDKKKLPENYINLVANGTIPKSGKPSSAAALSKKLKSRGRPKQRREIVTVYQSEISDNAVGIKLCIKKSDQSALVKKSTRKRSQKPRYKDIDSDNEDISIGPEKKRRKERSNNSEKQKKSNVSDVRPLIDQSPWGCKIPEEILFEIFSYVVESEGCLPTLFRLGQVCTLWRKVSIAPKLWSNLDWGSCIKDRYRTEAKLKWLIENRMKGCKELNISNWKVSDIQCVLRRLAESCPELVGITLSGWKGFTSEHLNFLVKEFKSLERIDLSSINVELHPNRSGVALQTLCFAIQTLGERLTHLHLAHNRLAGVPQIITTLSTYCPNLLLLDLSNVQTVAISHGILHIEKLQKGCQKLKILRITNSHIALSGVSLQEQMESPGFPELEELSVASFQESRLINDEFLQRILKTSTKLKLLDVRGCARLTHDSLIRLPAWDLKYLFLSGCSVTRDVGSGLELIASKWAHSLIEFDLAWANVKESLDNALKALAEKGIESPLTNLNLCGSSVSEEAVKEILANCPLLYSINLSSCRGLPRGVKRFINGPQLKELRDVLKVTLKVSQNADTSSH
ncbi:F-box/LRR-repeat protein 6 [Condylostylus longicornis]|uniref:F-box/LRR-repeat protein 6 n=1 Tax=Condylostylus longicornis TaxID=2530218 RepID=UPI00244DBA68|nr:F-box/LRR-repeat protein 6 [Condylostylus longicornis]XP_055379757.1 F-box/LRR-repeat protein 6 [Condylostylus longicornis]